MRLRQLASNELTPTERAELRSMLDAAFADHAGGFDDHDWQHALGGTHFLAEDGSEIVAHASVVERELVVGEHMLRTGYVEAVATRPDRQRRGHGTAIMRAVNRHIFEREYELGALGTGSQGFYARLGWLVWPAPTFVHAPEGLRATPDDDGYVMVLTTPATPALDLDLPISCDWRAGDVW